MRGEDDRPPPGGSGDSGPLGSLRSGDPDERQTAIASIRPDPEVALEVVRTLSEVCRSDPSPGVRAEAVRTLARFLEPIAKRPSSGDR